MIELHGSTSMRQTVLKLIVLDQLLQSIGLCNYIYDSSCDVHNVTFNKMGNVLANVQTQVNHICHIVSTL